jgi:antitoxin HicB
MPVRYGIDAYPVVLAADDNETVLVGFPDFPEAATFGDDADEALLRAVDALETAIMGRMSDREDIPYPTRPRGVRRFVALPTLSSAKIALYRTMREQGVRKAELARRMHCDFRQVDRLLDLRHHSRLDQLDAAFAALGKRLTIDLLDAPVSRRAGSGDPGRVRRRA